MTLLSTIINSWYGPIIGFVLGLIPLIVIHELGHFFMARILGVWVREFGIGYPPRIFKLFRWKETDFTLNWLPLGGFARMEGEETFTPEDEKTADTDETPSAVAPAEVTESAAPKKSEPTDYNVYEDREEARKHALYSKGPIQRIFIYLGGPVMNMITAWLIAVLIFVIGMPVYEPGIAEIAANSPAAIAGMQENDVFIAVNDIPVETSEDVIDITYEHLGEEIPVKLERDGETYTVTITPRENPPENEGAMGIMVGLQPIPGERITYTFGEALRYGTAHFGEITKVTLTLPFYIAQLGLSFKEARPVGVIGISQVAQYSMSQSLEIATITPFLQMVLMISISLGIFNLLPIPALDGGRILFSAIEKVRGKPLAPALEERIHMVALMIMMVLFVGITVLDIISPVPLP